MILLLLVFSFFVEVIFSESILEIFTHIKIAFSWNEMGGSDFWGKRPHWQDYGSQSFSVSPFSLSVHTILTKIFKSF